MISKIKQLMRDLKRKSSIYESVYNCISKVKVYALRIIPDTPYVKYKYYTSFGKKLNLDSPKSFNEKIQWLKLYDHRDEYITFVDKIEVKNYVDNLLGAGHTIPTLGVWDDVNDIDLDSLPDQFVLKCNHDCGSVFVCRDKKTIDWEKVKRKLSSSLKRNYYWGSREWPYKNVKPKVFAEQYMKDSDSDQDSGITDFKFFVFNKKIKMLYVSRGLEKHTTARISFYDLEGNELPFHRKDYRPIGEPLTLPRNYDEMLRICQTLADAVNNDFVRVDLYSINGNTYFSELTLYPCGTGIPFEPEEWDDKCGDLLTLTDIASISEGRE